MNKKLLIVTGIIVTAGLILLLAVFWQRQDMQPPTSNPGQGTTTSPFPTPDPGTTTGKIISIQTENGGNIQVKDFFDSPDVVEDSINNGLYYFGYHFINGGGENIPYVIGYIKQTDFFNIALYREPIGRSRREAEQYLMAHLGISQDQMCTLRYMVGVPHSVNEFYTGTSLGFSFCPGSMAIPE